MSGRSLEGRCLLVNYHYIQPSVDGPYGRMNGVAVEEFVQQVQTMRREMTPLAVEDLVPGRSVAWNEKSVGVVVTFDDATRDVFQHALPILRAAGLPATIYCCSLPVSEQRLLDVQKIHILMRRLGLQRFAKAFDEALEALFGRSVALEPLPESLEPVYRYDDEQTRRFKTRLNMQLPIRFVTETLSALFARFIGDERDAVRHVYMSMDEIAQASDWGFTIGLHTHSHRMLSRLDEQAQMHEISTPLEVFHDFVPQGRASLSYPFGIRGSWNSTTLECVRRACLDNCVTLTRVAYHPAVHTNPHEIPRFDVNDVFDRGGVLRRESLLRRVEWELQ